MRRLAKNQLTIRGFDEELQRRIYNLARAEGLSLNQAVLRLLRKGAGLDEPEEHDRVGSSLNDLIGTWTAAEARQFEEAVKDLESIDPALWQ